MGRLKGSKDGFYTRINIVCATCNKTFDVYPAHSKTAKYCSRSCKDKSLIGKKHTAEHNRNIGLGGTGKKRSYETCRRISLGNTGKKMSASSKVKMSIAKSTNRIPYVKTMEGYKLIYSPDHPHKNNGNYVLEHRLVMERSLGRYLLPTEVVHHINGIVDENHIENLMLFPDHYKHRTYHKTNPYTPVV